MKYFVFLVAVLFAGYAMAGSCNFVQQSNHCQNFVSSHVVAPVVTAPIVAQPILQVVTPYAANVQPVFVTPIQQQLNYGYAQNAVNTIVQREVVKVQNNNKLRDKLAVRNILRNRGANQVVKQKVVKQVQVNSY